MMLNSLIFLFNVQLRNKHDDDDDVINRPIVNYVSKQNIDKKKAMNTAVHL